jgi:hypothetical protein
LDIPASRIIYQIHFCSLHIAQSQVFSYCNTQQIKVVALPPTCSECLSLVTFPSRSQHFFLRLGSLQCLSHKWCKRLTCT